MKPQSWYFLEVIMVYLVMIVGQLLNFLQCVNCFIFSSVLQPFVMFVSVLLLSFPQGYYRRTPDYFPTLSRSRRGCVLVHLVHSTVLVNIQTEASRALQYWPPPNGFEGAADDIIMFAFSARKNSKLRCISVVCVYMWIFMFMCVFVCTFVDTIVVV